MGQIFVFFILSLFLRIGVSLQEQDEEELGRSNRYNDDEDEDMTDEKYNEVEGSRSDDAPFEHEDTDSENEDQDHTPDNEEDENKEDEEDEEDDEECETGGGTQVVTVVPKPGPSCSSAYTRIGCYNDPAKKGQRPLPDELDNHRDVTNRAYHGLLIKWKDYKHSLETLVSHCAARTKQKGHTHFGIEYYGECWSGKDSGRNFNKYGPSNNCINGTFAKCDIKKDCLCAGKAHTLFVYKL